MKFVRYFLLCTLFIIIGIVYSREVPKLKTWLINQVKVLSRKHAGVEIQTQSLGFTFFPPGVTFTDVKLTPMGPLKSVLAPTQIDSASVSLNPTSLLAGRFEIGSVILDHPVTSVFMRASPEPAKKKKFEFPWDLFINAPIKKVEINKADVRAKLEDSGLSVQVTDFSLNLEKTFQAAKVEIFSPKTLVKHSSVEETPTAIGFATRIILEHDAAEISALKITQGESFFVARAVARGNITHLDWTNLNGRTLAHVNLGQLKSLIKNFWPQLDIPALSGRANFEITATQKRAQRPALMAEVETQEVKVDKFQIGNLHTRLRYSNDIVRSEEIKLQSTAGLVRIEDLDVRMGSGIKFSARVLPEQMELRQTLINLGVDPTPLHMDISGRIPCEGTLLPQLHVECAGEVTGRNFRIHTTPENKTIAALDSFKITSHMLVDKNKIVFPGGQISIGSSTGEARGIVDFDKGFSFMYHSSNLDFRDIKSLADLKYMGAIELTGTTTGNGHTANMIAQAKMKNFWFEDYGLGTGTAEFRYEKSYLNFTQFDSRIGNTVYSGQISVKLSSPTGLTAHADIPQLDLEDLTTAFSKKVQLPFSAKGAGSATVDASGPFSLSELTYTLRSQVKQGVVAGETFTNAVFNVHGVKGHAFADDVHLKKGDSVLRLTGDVLPLGVANVAVKGDGLRLADFENIHALTSGLDGTLQFDMSLKEHILHPLISLRGAVSQTTVNQEPLDDSRFLLEVSPKAFKVDAQLFADKIKTSWTYPFVGHAPSSFKFLTENWNFSKMLMILGGNSKHDYETNLTAKINLASEEGGFWMSRGDAVVKDFYIRHGTSQMRNTKPIVIRFDDGLVTVESMQLDGDDTQISVTGNRNRKDSLNFNVNGRIDLGLLSFLTPFFRDIAGQLSLSTKIAGTSSRPELLGSAFINKGYFKLEAFPHAFENVNADYLFSQSRILINKVTGRLAGGDLSAAGSLTIRGYKDLPLELSGDLLHTTLAVPDGLTTKGNLHFGLTGNWFPYLFKGEYDIESGLYTKNLDDMAGSNILKRSSYLPKSILLKEFSPLELDVNAHFPKAVAVRNSLMELDVKGDLNIKGDPTHPILKGEINAVPAGKVFFRETPFVLSAAKVKFNNPTENNPTIYALATSRVRDWDVTLLIQGTAQKYDLKLSSSPPLTEQSIVSLLALGLTDEGMDKTKPSDHSSIQGYQAGSVILSQNPLQSQLKRQLGVNVRLSQTVDDTRNLVFPRVIAEKQWTPQFSTSVSRTIGERVTSELNLEYKLNRHFSVLGSYEQREFDNFAASTSTATTSTTAAPQTSGSNAYLTPIFGLDLQFQTEFK